MEIEFEQPGTSTMEHDTSATYRCPSCGKDNELHYEFCLGCGQRLEPTGALPVAPAHAATQEMPVVETRSTKKGIWILIALAIALVAAGAVLIKLVIS